MENKNNKKIERLNFYNLKKSMISKHFRIKSELGNFINFNESNFKKDNENKKKLEIIFKRSIEKFKENNDYLEKKNINKKKILGKKIFKTLEKYNEKFKLINNQISKNSNLVQSNYTNVINKNNSNKNFKVKKIKNNYNSINSMNFRIRKKIHGGKSKNKFFKIANFICLTKTLTKNFFTTSSRNNNLHFYKGKNIIINQNSFKPDNNELCTLDYIISDNNEYLILYGGINNYKNEEIHYMNLKNMIWKNYNFKNGLMSRFAHSSCVYENKLIIYFGGQKNINFKQDRNYWLYSDLRILNIEKEKFKMIKLNIVSKSYPCARKYHSACLKKNEIYIYGGIDSKHNILNDIWKGIIYFDNNSVYWSKFFYSKNELSFCKHSIFSIENENSISKTEFSNKIFTFGGIDENNNLSNNWYSFLINKKENFWSKLVLKGYKPEKRFGFKLIFNNKLESVVIFGGKGKRGNVLNDLYLANFFKKEWIIVNIEKKSLIKRYSFGFAIQNNNIFIFGGIDNENQLRGDLEKIKIYKNNK